MKILAPVTTALLAIALLGSSRAGAQEAKPQATERLFLWKATSPTTTVHLLGSIHVANESMYPLAPEIDKAFAESRTLAVEVDLTKVDMTAMQGVLAEKGMYEPGDSIEKHVPKQTMDMLRDYLSKRGMPAEAMERFRPWALAVTITMLEVQSHGYDPALGIDKHFMDRKGTRKVVELESAEEQIELLSSLPPKLEAEFLGSTLDSARWTKDLMARVIDLWKKGDAGELEKTLITQPLLERPELRPVFVKMFDERNEKMAAKIDQFLKGDQPVFVVVGAGHLLGNRGIVKLLEKKGYHLEQVKRAAKAETAEAATMDKPAAEKKPAKRGYAPAGAFSD